MDVDSEAGQESVIEAVALRYAYKKAVLVDFDLRVGAGEVVALAGLNGAGKTTALNLISGLRRAPEGKVRILGGDPLEARTRRNLFALSETSEIPPHLLAREVVKLTLDLYGRPASRTIIEGLLQRVGLGAVARQRTSTFSKGMRRRLELACLLASDTRCWILDEPQSGLDPQGLGLLRELCREARDQGRCVLMACHVLADLRALADRVVVLHEGKTLFSGPLAQLSGALDEEAFALRGGDAGTLEALREAARAHGAELRGPELSLDALEEYLAAPTPLEEEPR